MQGLDELPAPLRIVDQIILEKGIALDHPDVAEYLIQHTGGSTGAPFAAQLVQ
jgi:hypothetical protein